MPRLYMLVRSIRRRHGSTRNKPKRQPITPNILLALKKYLQSCLNYTATDKLMLWAAFTTAFFGFLRSSEFTLPTTRTFSKDSNLLLSDVSIHQNHISIVIKSSKCDPFRQGCIIRLSRTPNHLCPVSALIHFINNHPTRTGPLFTFTDKTYLTCRKLNQILQHALSPHISRPITTHSFRIGAASTAAAAGFPLWLIQKLRRWNSDCFRIYLALPDSTIANVCHSLSLPRQIQGTFDPDLI